MDPFLQNRIMLNRRQFFSKTAAGIGTAALASVMMPELFDTPASAAYTSMPRLPHGLPKAKRIIYMFQSGAPSQLDLFDYKPQMEKYFDQELPEDIRKGQRLTTMTSGQTRFPIAPTKYKFAQYGPSGAWISELLPHTARIADKICFIKSMHTEAINHDPAITFFQTGSQQPGRPSIGAWMSYGLGSENQNLPTFVAMSSRGTGRPSCQPLYDRLWGAGFLPTHHQGVKFRSSSDPVLYLSNPPGVDKKTRRRMLDDLAKINLEKREEYLDPEINTRITQYEMAYRMQTSIPDLTDFSNEPEYIFDMYGPDSRKKGTYAYNCILARRLAERGVRFVQMFHMGWDQHGNLPKQLPGQCRDTDQPSSALVLDLEQRGLLDDTLVIWGGEFGRTIYCQGKLTKTNYGRDHHPRCFTIWMAGGGIKPGFSLGQTDDHSYNVTQDPVHIHDLHATILNQMGLDHKKLTYKFQGRRYRLTDVSGHVIKPILA